MGFMELAIVVGGVVILALAGTFFSKLRRRRRSKDRAPDEIYPLW